MQLTDAGKESIETFANRIVDERIKDIMFLGEQGNLNFFYLFYYAILYDTDQHVRFAALKRVHAFKEAPLFTDLLKKLEQPGLGDQLEPYYSMMLSRLGTIDKKEEPDQRIPLKTIMEVYEYIDANFKGETETLWIDDTLLDPQRMNMAIIGDRILRAGYMLKNSEQKEGYRLYSFSKL